MLALLILGTISFFNCYERYKPVGPELLIDPEFAEGFAHWIWSGRGIAEPAGDGSIVLRAPARGADIAVRQSLANPTRYSLLQLSGELKAHDIHPGKRFWHKGRLVLVCFDKDQRMLNVPHLVADLEGTRAWQSYQEVFRIPRAAQQVRVGVQLIGATGSLAFKKLSLREVRERDHYSFYRSLGIATWVLGLAWLSLPFIARLRFDLPHCLIYLILTSVFIGTLLPGPLKIRILAEIDTVLAHIAPYAEPENDVAHEVPMGSTASDKLGHLLIFALLAFAVRWAYPKENLLALLTSLLALAAISEVLQFYAEGRIPRLLDFLVDSAGLFIGIGLLELVCITKHRLKFRYPNNV